MSDQGQNAIIPIKGTERGLQVQSLDQMRRWALYVVDSDLAPASFKTESQVIVATQYARELGFGLMQGLRSIAVIGGRPLIYGDAALALVKKSGLLKQFQEKVSGTGDDMLAFVSSVRLDPNGMESLVETTFTVADARQAGLWGKSGPWKTHPKRMLKYKARAFNLRDNFPDVLMGMHTVEEMEGEDFEPLPAPDCTTPKRADRKPVENTFTEPAPEVAQGEIVDPEPSTGPTEAPDEAPAGTADPETLKAMFAGVVNAFNDLVYERNPNFSLGKLEKLFMAFATYALMVDEADIPAVDDWTSELLKTLNDALAGGLPQPIIDMIPVEEAEDVKEPSES